MLLLFLFLFVLFFLFFFLFPASSPSVIYTLSLHDALPISQPSFALFAYPDAVRDAFFAFRMRLWNRKKQADAKNRSEEHTSELQSLRHLVCRLLLEKKKKKKINNIDKNIKIHSVI